MSMSTHFTPNVDCETQTDYTWVHTTIPTMIPVKSAFRDVPRGEYRSLPTSSGSGSGSVSTSGSLSSVSTLSSIHDEHDEDHSTLEPLIPPYDYIIWFSFDGASRGNPGPSGCGAVAYIEKTIPDEENRSKTKLMTMSHHIPDTTNNMAEWCALAYGLKMLVKAIAKKRIRINRVDLRIQGDSQLVIQQLLGNWKIRDSKFTKWFNMSHEYLSQFGAWTAKSVYRKYNMVADSLANEAIDNHP